MMKLNEKEKNAIVNEALFNLGTYFITNERGPFEDCKEMYGVAYNLIEELYVGDSELINGIPWPTTETQAQAEEMINEVLTFIESNGDVRNWLLQVLKDNELQSLYEESYEIFKYEFFETEEEREKALEPIEKRIKELLAEAETMKEAWDSFKKFKYGDKDFDWFL